MPSKKNVFSQMLLMRHLLLIVVLFLFSCAQKSQAYPPIGGFLDKEDMEISKNRAKNLNDTERLQIKEWMSTRPEKYYPMGLNYWVDIENLDKNIKRKDGQKISYRYDVYDFDMTELYKNKGQSEVPIGHFEDLKAVQDVLLYLPRGMEVTLLIPSVLAYGTYGDDDKISNDIPLIIKLRMQ